MSSSPVSISRSERSNLNVDARIDLARRFRIPK
jgi:hypothetical protein